MSKRMLIAVGAILLVLLVGAGVLGARQLTHTQRDLAATANCCDDPNCPPGCAPDCPPNCRPSDDCCNDPNGPPGCSPDCPPDCQGAKAGAAADEEGKTKRDCPPCPECP
jgi:hypothetical protein